LWRRGKNARRFCVKFAYQARRDALRCGRGPARTGRRVHTGTARTLPVIAARYRDKRCGRGRTSARQCACRSAAATPARRRRAARSHSTAGVLSHLRGPHHVAAVDRENAQRSGSISERVEPGHGRKAPTPTRRSGPNKARSVAVDAPETDQAPGRARGLPALSSMGRERPAGSRDSDRRPRLASGRIKTRVSVAAAIVDWLRQPRCVREKRWACRRLSVLPDHARGPCGGRGDLDRPAQGRARRRRLGSSTGLVGLEAAPSPPSVARTVR